MLIETATVIHYQDGIALVQCYAKSACGSCAARSHCGSKALSSLSGEKSAPRFELKINQPLKAGDMIKLGLAEHKLINAIFWLYGIPLMTLLLSAMVLSSYLTNELQIAMGMLFLTACSFVCVKKVLARKPILEFTPIFLGKID